MIRVFSFLIFFVGVVSAMVVPFTFGASGAIALLAFLVSRIMEEGIRARQYRNSLLGDEVTQSKYSGFLTAS